MISTISGTYRCVHQLSSHNCLSLIGSWFLPLITTQLLEPPIHGNWELTCHVHQLIFYWGISHIMHTYTIRKHGGFSKKGYLKIIQHQSFLVVNQPCWLPYFKKPPSTVQLWLLINKDCLKPPATFPFQPTTIGDTSYHYCQPQTKANNNCPPMSSLYVFNSPYIPSFPLLPTIVTGYPLHLITPC